jgi:hypothetical protein
MQGESIEAAYLAQLAQQRRLQPTLGSFLGVLIGTPGGEYRDLELAREPGHLWGRDGAVVSRCMRGESIEIWISQGRHGAVVSSCMRGESIEIRNSRVSLATLCAGKKAMASGLSFASVSRPGRQSTIAAR